ncbi:MAG TPA: GIY-YIG nuclease family protein [Candidatus Binatia bacterium]|nr:GIY-YIG nuclease family protein [Candidatus Binatia bacterium]
MLFFGAHSWRGQSGRRYRFKCVLTKQGLPPAGTGGIYMFVRRRFAFFLEVLYVGKAHDLRSRLMGHEKWGRAFWYYGATERYVLGPIRDEVDRRRIEEDLIKGLKPRMNDMEIPQARAASARRTAQAARLFDMSLGRRTQRA